MVHYRAVPAPTARLRRTASLDPRLLVVAAATLWGTTGTARALGPDDASPTAVGALRLIVGGACLLAAQRAGWLAGRSPRAARPREPAPGIVDMAGVVDEIGSDETGGGETGGTAASDPGAAGGTAPPAAVSRRPGRDSLAGVAVAAGAMAAYQPLFFGGVARTGVAVGTVVGIGSSPVFAGLLGALVRGERPGRRWLAATALALTGTALLVGTGGGDDVDPSGVGLALGAGLAYAVYVLASKLVLDRGGTADDLTVRVFTLAAVLLVPVAAFAGIGPLLSLDGAVMVLHLGVVTVAVAYVLFGRGLEGVGVGAAGTLTLAEPATAALLGVLVVGERFGGTTAAGVALIGVGLVTLVARRR
jgi:drug/metabolite transporter, DME family